MLKHFSLRFRYLISFLLLVVLMTVFSVYICQSNLVMARTYSAQMTTQTFNNVKNDIAGILTRCEDLAKGVVGTIADSNLCKDSAGHTKVQTDSHIFPLLDDLQNQLNVNSEVLLYIRGDSSIYTATEKMLYDTYVNYTKPGLMLDEAGLFTKMMKVNQPVILGIPSQTGHNQVAYLVPVQCSGYTCVIMTYLFPYDVFTEKFSNYLGTMDADLFIYTGSFKTVYQHTSGDGYLPLAGLFKVPGSGFITHRADRTDYVILREYELTHNLTYVLCTDEEQFYSSIRSSYTSQILLLSGVICILLLLAFVLTQMNFRPIQALASDILGHRPPQDANELELIRTSYDSSQKYVKDLNAIAVNHFLTKLVGNNISSRMEYDYLLLCTGVHFSCSAYSMIYILFPSVADDASLEHTQSLCRRRVPEHGQAISTILYAEHAVCILLNFDPEEASSDYPTQYAASLQQYISEYSVTEAQFGISTVCTDPMKLTNSFLEASAAVQLAPLNRHDSILVYNASDQKAYNTAISSCMSPAQKSLLIECLRHGETSLAINAFDDIANSLTESAGSLLMLRFFSTELINLIVTQAQPFGVEFPASQMETLLHFNSGREFYDTGREFLRETCEMIRSRLFQQSVAEKSRVIVYLQQHFKDSDLSVQSAADALKISRQQINEMLKEDIGQGFAQYISSLRMQEFKRLLIETDSTVQSLVEEVGYIDVPNFLRKFKSAEGVTPTQYRTLHQQKQA